jgi:TonB family protein
MLVWFVCGSPSLAGDDSKAPAKDGGRVVEQLDATTKVITSDGGVGTAPVLISGSELKTCVESPAGTITGQEKPTVVLLKINSAGVPLAVSILTSSGSKELDRRILKCYRKTRYQPGLIDGRPSSADLEIQWKWDSYLPQTTCSASMRVGATVRIGVTPSSTEPEALPPTGEAILCNCGKEDGEVGEPVIVSSSSNPRFDEGALLLMKRPGKKWHGPAGCAAYRFEFTTRESTPHAEK